MCMDAPKYGNDDERADWIVGEVFTYVVDQFEKYDTKFGKMTTGVSPCQAIRQSGNGRRPAVRPIRLDTLTDGIGATGGTTLMDLQRF